MSKIILCVELPIPVIENIIMVVSKRSVLISIGVLELLFDKDLLLFQVAYFFPRKLFSF